MVTAGHSNELGNNLFSSLGEGELSNSLVIFAFSEQGNDRQGTIVYYRRLCFATENENIIINSLWLLIESICLR